MQTYRFTLCTIKDKGENNISHPNNQKTDLTHSSLLVQDLFGKATACNAKLPVKLLDKQLLPDLHI